MNIVLIGYRGSGKSSIGQILALGTGREFIDTDHLIVRQAGRSIKEIFEREGEVGFREREMTAVTEACAVGGRVIAAGGGAILRAQNVLAFRANGCVIWLQASPEALFARIQADSATNNTRPNLTAQGGIEEVRKILAARTPLYQSAAHHVLNVEGISVEAAAERVMALVPQLRQP